MQRCGFTAERSWPVGNTPSIARTFERFLFEHLQQFCPCDDIFQFAYKKGLSTSDAIVTLLQNVIDGLDEEKTTIVRALFLDYSSAFNTVSRSTILNKLAASCPPWLIDLMKCYFSNVTQFVNGSGKRKSRPMNCDTGVIQGNVLSPYLFTLVTAELKAQTKKSLFVKFSDDTVLSHKIKNGDDFDEYEKAIKHVEDWSVKNHLILNGSKTQELVFFQRGTDSGRLKEY